MKSRNAFVLSLFLLGLTSARLVARQEKLPLQPFLTNGCHINIQPIGAAPFTIGLEFSGAVNPDGHLKFAITTGDRPVVIGRPDLQAVAKANKKYRVVVESLQQDSPLCWLLDTDDMTRQYFYVYDDDSKPSYKGYAIVPQLRGDDGVDLYVHIGEHAIRIPAYH